MVELGDPTTQGVWVYAEEQWLRCGGVKGEREGVHRKGSPLHQEALWSARVSMLRDIFLPSQLAKLRGPKKITKIQKKKRKEKKRGLLFLCKPT